MNCPEALDLVGQALEGTLPGAEKAGFDEHLRECSVCQSYVEQMRLTVQALRRLPKSGRPNPRRAELIEAYRRKFR